MGDVVMFDGGKKDDMDMAEVLEMFVMEKMVVESGRGVSGCGCGCWLRGLDAAVAGTFGGGRLGPRRLVYDYEKALGVMSAESLAFFVREGVGDMLCWIGSCPSPFFAGRLVVSGRLWERLGKGDGRSEGQEWEAGELAELAGGFGRIVSRQAERERVFKAEMRRSSLRVAA